MLQWTGGSRRQVYASRKSTQSRQRQYFEQKKRQQQQRPGGQQNQDDTDGACGQAYGDQAPRSLDVLSLNNLAASISQRNNGSENVDGAVPHVDRANFNASPSPMEALKKITSAYNINSKETSSHPRLPSPFGHEDVTTAVNHHEDPLGCKTSPSKNCGAKKRNQNVDLYSGEMSLIDLVKYEGPKSKSTAQPARESHVSFSVKGLGHIKMETPPQSPRSTKRILPLPPKAMRYTQNKARRSMPFDATKGLDSLMNGISMMKERSASHKMGSLVDESSYERRNLCYFSHPFENYSDNLYPEDEDMFCKPQAQEGWHCKPQEGWHSRFGRTDDNLPHVNSERPWKIESFSSDDHFPTPGADQFDTFDSSFIEQRTSTRPSTRCGTSGHDIFSDQSLLDDDDDMLHFDWERQPPFKKRPNSNSNFGPSAWSSEMVDDSDKRKSPLSEESCSSAAGMKDRTCKSTLSAKCEENNMNEKDDFHTCLDKLDIPKMDVHLDETSLFKDQEEYYKRATDQKNLEADYWPDKAMEQQRTREPSCRLSLQEKFSDWGSSTSHLKGSSGPDNRSSCTVVREDKTFNSIPDMGEYQTVGSTERRPPSKVHSVFHRPDSAALYDDIHLQNPVSDIFGDKIEFSDPFRAKGLRGDVDLCTFLGQKVDKKKEDNFDSFKNPNADIFHPASSACQTVFGQRSAYSQQSGKDSRRQGFDPGIDFKESRQGFDPASSVSQTVFGQRTACSQQSGKDSRRQDFDPGIDFQESRQKTFWEDGHVSNGTFQGNVELSGLLSRKSGEKNKDGIEKFKMRETKMSRQTSQRSADCRAEMSEAGTCSDGSEVTNYPVVKKEISSEAAQLPANLNLQENAGEMFQIHAQVDCVRKETMEIPGVDFKAPLPFRNKIHDGGDHTKSITMFQSPFMAEKVGIEKKVLTGMSPHNSDIQYEVMLERRVLQRLCVQKISVDTPTRDKLAKVTGFRTTENEPVLPKSV
uniref:Uncharacterized protein n=1 Tax=Avena sativa TaxID=4498 RepID=A0ACD5TR44_AVESA